MGNFIEGARTLLKEDGSPKYTGDLPKSEPLKIPNLTGRVLEIASTCPLGLLQRHSEALLTLQVDLVSALKKDDIWTKYFWETGFNDLKRHAPEIVLPQLQELLDREVPRD